MKTLGDLLSEGYKPKSSQKIWDENAVLHFWDKNSKSLDDGHISSHAWESDVDGQISLLNNNQIDPYEFYLHPYYPDKEIKMIEIVADMPALYKGDLYKIQEIIPKWDLEDHGELPAMNGIRYEHAKISEFYTSSFMDGFPQWFKPFYAEMDEIRMIIPMDGGTKRKAHRLVTGVKNEQLFELV